MAALVWALFTTWDVLISAVLWTKMRSVLEPFSVVSIENDKIIV